MSSPSISLLHNPFDPVFCIATGIAIAAILYTGVVLRIALYSKNKKRRKRARMLLRKLLGGSR